MDVVHSEEGECLRLRLFDLVGLRLLIYDVILVSFGTHISFIVAGAAFCFAQGGKDVLIRDLLNNDIQLCRGILMSREHLAGAHNNDSRPHLNLVL